MRLSTLLNLIGYMLLTLGAIFLLGLNDNLSAIVLFGGAGGVFVSNLLHLSFSYPSETKDAKRGN